MNECRTCGQDVPEQASREDAVAGVNRIMALLGATPTGYDTTGTATGYVSEAKVASHRNGIAGESFYVSLFTGPDGQRMVAVMFAGKGRTAVFDVDELSAGNISMGDGNSWRGDEFEPELETAVLVYEAGRMAS